MINTLTNIIIDNYNGVEIKDSVKSEQWKKIAKENKFEKMLWKILNETMFVGDGAFRYSYDEEISDLPILEWFSGDKVEFVYRRGRLVETFKNYFY